MPSILDNGSTQESTDPVLLSLNSTAKNVIGQNSKLKKLSGHNRSLLSSISFVFYFHVFI